MSTFTITVCCTVAEFFLSSQRPLANSLVECSGVAPLKTRGAGVFILNHSKYCLDKSHYIGKKIGQSLYEEAKILAKKITLFMTMMGAALALLLIPLSFLLKYIYNVSDDVIKMAQTFLYMTVVLYPFCATNMSIVVGVCRSGGDTIFALFMDVGFLWLISLPLGCVAVSFWHLPYYLIFIILRSEDCLKCGLGLYRLMSGKWLSDVTK